MSTLKRRPDRKGGTYYVYYYDENGKYRGQSLGVTGEGEAWIKKHEFDRELETRRALSREAANAEETIGWRALAMLTDGRGYSEQWRGAETMRQRMTDPVKVLDRALETIDKREQEKRDAEERERRERDLPVDVFWDRYRQWSLDGNRSPFTLTAYQTAWRKLLHHMKPERINDVTPDMIAELRRKLRDDNLAEEGVTQYLISLQGVFSTAIEMGHYLQPNPINIKRRFRPHSTDRRALTKEECEKILEEASRLGERNTYLLIAIALHTGMRKTEITNLRWEDFDFSRCSPAAGAPEPVVNVTNKAENKRRGIVKFTTKSKDRRTIPVKRELVEILEPYRQADGYVITPKKGRHVRRTNYEVPREFNEVRKNTGIDFTLHTLRHTFASHAAMAGVSIFKISKWLGHSTVQVTAAIYAHLQEHDEDINRF